MRLPKNALKEAGNLTCGTKPIISDQVLETARTDTDTALKDLESRLSGLGPAEVDERIKRYGLNEIGREKHPSPLMRLWDNVKNPLVILLIALGVLSYLTGDQRVTSSPIRFHSSRAGLTGH